MTLIQPTGELGIMIKKELNEDINTRENDIKHIKDWLRLQPHLPDTLNDMIILTFLRGSSFSLEKCKKKIDLYFTMRNAAPEFFSNRNMHNQTMQDTFEIMQMPPLPGVTPDGRRVNILRGVFKEGAVIHITEGIKALMMIGDIRMMEETHGVAGDIFVLDSTNVLFGHLSLYTPTLARKFLISVQDSFPVKLKQVHVINVSPVVDAIYKLCKPLVKEKIKKRVFFHSKIHTLYEYIPREMLPEEYGGDAGSINDIHKAWKEKLCSYTDWFKEQESIKADESRRPGKPKTKDELFGTDGSFRQLIID